MHAYALGWKSSFKTKTVLYIVEIKLHWFVFLCI